MLNTPRPPYGLAALVAVVATWSAILPFDRPTWWLEVAPVLLAAPLIALSWRRFPLTPLLCAAVALHMILLLYGGHYTYAETPFGNWLREQLGTERNPFDRLGHLAQGFVPALVVREILLRRSPLHAGKWLTFITLSICLAISAAYELLEFAAAMAIGQGADEFLATQGDPWDTQWDMLCALIGATLSLLLLSPLHNHQIAKLRRFS
ncbi:DUF2238 domain-containing protein [Microvirgula aerodenitrificans]|uniref:DUF2238 domain-containing protein n=1 Tax=Microvirgula aerodenitrificans TaxID=57480 RepID=A0A2S0PAF5_9NEIS|nr:DUF2238 domain-containing protein [Microvirgula aerodenitrificans]AVY94336.1 DUF2238 domain-containing protein [Microvirgula aerodenitrificans]